MKKVLTIAGSDSCGGAGIQADLKTFSANGTYGMSVISAIIAQNTKGVTKILTLNRDIVEAQLDAIFSDIEVDAIKIGMVSQIEIIEVIAEKLIQYKGKKIVLDPVMVSKSGHNLLERESVKKLIEKLIPLATIVTPNLPEAMEIMKAIGENVQEITTEEEMKYVAKKIFALGCKSVLIKGGHLKGDALDILYDGTSYYRYINKRIETINTHGTGCTLSSAICACLAKGYPLKDSVENAKIYITKAIENSFSIGSGVGPVHHFYKFYNKDGEIN
ncbi:MAG: bifunctional hydroxymethylpyrimidine kinase/phosphomethylpyrimidine kinase [Fusobacteriaceae bacterium]